MLFNKHIGQLELLLAGAFVLFYCFYIGKVIYICLKLQTSFHKVIPKLILRTIYFSLMLIALLAPSFGDIKKQVKAVGKDIFIAVDLSASMNASDIAPSRLHKAKQELHQLVDKFDGDRIGLIIFTSEAFVQCPLTYDHDALNIFISSLNTKLITSQGTDLGEPIRLAIEKFEQYGKSQEITKSKILILFTDGEDFGDETKNITGSLQKDNIRLFTVGIGTKQGSGVPVKGGFKHDKEGRLVNSQLNRSLLVSLANRDKKSYYEISDKQNEIQKLAADIADLEGEVLATKTIDVSANKYIYFLTVAFFLMVIDVLVTVKAIKL